MICPVESPARRKQEEVVEVERVLTFELERDTKNTYRFQEVPKGAPPLIGTLYIQKWAFEGSSQGDHRDHRGMGLRGKLPRRSP
jgi:hypothetical protein